MSEQEMRERSLENARRTAYEAVCPPMNRAERRTAKGRMLVAMGEAAALRAEVEFLRAELEEHRGIEHLDRAAAQAAPRVQTPATL